MHDMQEKLSVKDNSDLTKKAIKGIYELKSLTNKQIKNNKDMKINLLNNLTGINSHENLTLSVIMDCRAPTANEFRSKIWFKKLDLELLKNNQG